MTTVTLNLPDDVFKFLELRAAIDDMRVPESLEKFLTELVHARKENRPVILTDCN